MSNHNKFEKAETWRILDILLTGVFLTKRGLRNN